MDEVFARARVAYIFLIAIAVLLGCVVRSTPGHRVSSLDPYEALPTGYDVSWPNCGATRPKVPTWGVVGVTGGLSLHASRCLPLETSWFTAPVSLYVNTGYSGRLLALRFSHSPKKCLPYDSACIAYDYGYAEGVYAVKLASSQGIHSELWWLDVETENSWDTVPSVNRASIQGTIDAIRHETVFARIGVYAFPGQWDIITGDWRPNLPAWVATGSDDRAAAVQACKQPSFTGGPVWLAQYTVGLDRDIPC